MSYLCVDGEQTQTAVALLDEDGASSLEGGAADHPIEASGVRGSPQGGQGYHGRVTHDTRGLGRLASQSRMLQPQGVHA